MSALEKTPETTAESRTPLMTLAGVSQVFDTKAGPIRAVDNIDLSVNPGEVLCLVGESGSGKTTAARMAAGLARPTDGKVEFAGNDIWSMNRSDFGRFRRGVQYVHQDPYASLNPTRTILQTITAPLLKHRVVKGNKAAADKAAEPGRAAEGLHLQPAVQVRHGRVPRGRTGPAPGDRRAGQRP